MARVKGALDLRVRAADGGGSLLLVAGDIDLAAADALQRSIGQAARDGGVEVDLRAMSFCGSTGLRALILTARAAEARGVGIRFRVAEGPVARLFDLTCADEHLDVRRD